MIRRSPALLPNAENKLACIVRPPRDIVAGMAHRTPAAANALGLDGFIEPDDQGLSLDELSQAYAAVLAKGADPYEVADQGDAAVAATLAPTEQELSVKTVGDADA